MTPRKLNVAIARFPYGGNGGISSEHPGICDWLVPLSQKLREDERVGEVLSFRISDTPITMCRNQAVQKAIEQGADLLLMIDSDQGPDAHLSTNVNHHHIINPHAKPFWDSSFDHMYEHYEEGPRVVGAPYCGPPPGECVYVFEWQTGESEDPNVPFKLGMISREDAAKRSGLEAVGALPTGLILFDLRLFDYLPKPWFSYEYEGDGVACPSCHQPIRGPQTHKASTEDVVLTRDVSMDIHTKLGYNPVIVNWDAWASHFKPKAVGMPVCVTSDQVAGKLAQAVKEGMRQGERYKVVGDPAHVYQVPSLETSTNGSGNRGWHIEAEPE